MEEATQIHREQQVRRLLRLLLRLLPRLLPRLLRPPTDSTPVPVRAKFSIDWAARSRPGNTRAVPSSAVSIVVTFPNNASMTSDVAVRLVINRDANRIEAYKADYIGDTDMLMGRYKATITAYAEPDGTGAIVGTTTVSVTILADGTGLGTLATDGKVKKAYVHEADTLFVGDKSLLEFGATDKYGNVLLLTPGSAFFEISSGNDVLKLLSNEQVEALKPGDATIGVTVDGVKSDPLPVKVVKQCCYLC